MGLKVYPETTTNKKEVPHSVREPLTTHIAAEHRETTETKIVASIHETDEATEETVPKTTLF